MEDTPTQKPRIVIIGAGFGGLEAAKKLKDRERGRLKAAIEDAQLDGRLQSKEEAMQFIRREFPLEIKISS